MTMLPAHRALNRALVQARAFLAALLHASRALDKCDRFTEVRPVGPVVTLALSLLARSKPTMPHPGEVTAVSHACTSEIRIPSPWD